MRKKPMDYINVVDVESTCWQGEPPRGMVSDIIEIGVCQIQLGDPISIGSKRSIFVRPARSTVSDFCTSLTSITQKDVEGGMSLQKACTHLVEQTGSMDRIWASYGDYDRHQFERNCRDLKVRYPFGSRHINIKSLVAACMGWEGELGMAEALDRLGIPLNGTHHRAGDDAANISSILARILGAARQPLAK